VVRRKPTHLLERHVADRAHHRAGDGAGVGECLHVGPGLFLAGPSELRDPKVEGLYEPVPCQEQVLGLGVAVDDAALVRAAWPPSGRSRHRSRLRRAVPGRCPKHQHGGADADLVSVG